MVREFLYAVEVLVCYYGGLVAVEEAVDFLHIVEKHILVTDGHREDMVHRQVAEHAALYLHFLSVHFPLHLVAGQ